MTYHETACTVLDVLREEAQALSGAINQLLRDEPLRRRLGLGAAERARRLFSTEAMMRGVVDVYESVLARRRAA